MSSHDHRVMTSSKNPNWRTPQPLRDALHAEFPLAIDLAADAKNSVCAEWLGPGSTLGETTDALAFQSWATLIPEYSYGFLNPPYARRWPDLQTGEERSWPIEPWIERAWLTSYYGRGVVGVLPAAIQTGWWKQYIWTGGYPDSRDSMSAIHRATEIRLIPHRVSFDPPPGVSESQNANVNTAIVIWHPFNPRLQEPWVPLVRYWSYR